MGPRAGLDGRNISSPPEFYFNFIVLSIIYRGTYIISASYFGSAFPIPRHLALTLAQPHSSSVRVSPPHTMSHPDNGLLLSWVLA